MRTLPLSSLLLTTLLLGAGCAGTRPPHAPLPGTFPNHTAAQILANLRLSPDTLVAFRATASISVRTPAQGGSFTAEMQHRRDDSLLLRIRGTFGIEAGQALLTPDSFFVYDRLNNQLLYGPVDRAGDFLPAPVTTGDRFAALLGLLVPDPDISWQVRADERYYYLSEPEGRIAYVVDPAVWRVIRHEVRSASGTILEDRVYAEFERFGALYMPRRIVYRRPPDDVFAALYYRTLTLNPPLQPFTLKVDASARRIPVPASE
ncbi:DUF4292 domain-containing protein [Rhodocaloribacter litoris]|uniref:DUF4292 domain-containing protein n=1 Tax=Rhodocaloribacter litoris TaxID=2558931 RepID=UPI001421F8A9|nr:DUF4292 domain-containing protein [Rhodocaloribacter litoris]QXD14724.1 DUF4292 domain-containing protein [Rhodocaloribacter litoris]